MHDNDFDGALPASWASLTNLTNFQIQNNNLDRDADHNAFVSSALTAWYAAIASVNSSNQSDLEAPVISGTGTLWDVPDPFTYEVTIQENSYAVNNTSQGMQVQFSGASNCQSLQSTRVTENN